MVKITDRDEKIFNILFRLRYMTPKQLSDYLGCHIKSVYDRVEKLVNDGYIESTLALSINKRIYSNGWMLRKNHEQLSYRKKVVINKNTLSEYLLINDIYIHMIKEHGVKEENVTTEREIHWKKIGLTDKRKKIIPKLVIEQDGHLIAIEFERKIKKQDVLRDSFRNYILYTNFYCLRYLCATENIKKQIIKTAKKEDVTFVKAYTIDEFFNGIDIIGF